MADWVNTFPGARQAAATAKHAFGRVMRTGSTPKHVGLIMDGNRRYARNHKIEMKEGHSLGFESMAKVLELLYELGVECATVYAFSIENFSRLLHEVDWLMLLAKQRFQQIAQQGELCLQYGIRIRIIGNTKLLSRDVRSVLREVEEMTSSHTRATLNVCFPYTSRDEMTHAVRQAVTESPSEIDETAISLRLFTADAPPLDLLIRTLGTYRLSDFLLWQCVSSDCAIVFSPQLWPAFGPWDMAKILIQWSYNKYWYGNGGGIRQSECA